MFEIQPYTAIAGNFSVVDPRVADDERGRGAARAEVAPGRPSRAQAFEIIAQSGEGIRGLGIGRVNV